LDEEAKEVRPWGRLLLLGACIGVLTTVITLVVYVNMWPHQLKPNGMSYAELVTVILAALGVMLAVLALFVAALAVWGITTFQRMVRETARTYVSNDIEKGQLRNHLESLVTDHMNKASEPGGWFEQILKAEALRISISGADSPASGVRARPDRAGEDEDEGEV
jgi:hypothetical protein